jgi:hypothetical protein
MQFDSDEACLAYASFDLWMSQQLEQLVNEWIALAAPRDQTRVSAWGTGRHSLKPAHPQED